MKRLILLLIALPFMFQNLSVSHAAEDPVTHSFILFPLQADSTVLENIDSPQNLILEEIQSNGNLSLLSHDSPAVSILDSSKVSTTEQVVDFGKNHNADLVGMFRIEDVSSRLYMEFRVFDTQSGNLQFIEDTPSFIEYSEWESVGKELVDLFLASQESPRGYVTITTTPEECRVDVSGRAAGISPITLGLTGNERYQLRASRIGYYSNQKNIYITPHDTLNVTLRLKRASKRKASTASIRLLVSGGWPFNQTSSNLDTRFSLNDGESYGIGLTVGEQWRLNFGYLNYRSDNTSISRGDWEKYGAIDTPYTKATVYYSGLKYAAGSRGLRGIVGLGLAGMKQSIEVRLAEDAPPEKVIKRDTVLEIGWTLHAGVEFSMSDHLITQFGFVHTRNFASKSTWKDSDESVDPFWESAFRAFRSFTVIHISLGYRI